MDILNATLNSRQAGTLQPAPSNSFASLLSTLIPPLAIGSASFAVFLALRRTLKRVYQARSPRARILQIREDTVFGWMYELAKVSDTQLLGYHSIDAYLFLRFLKLLGVIAFGGCIITWPPLFVVNAMGGGSATQFDVLAITNVRSPKLFFVHAIVAWIFYSAVMAAILRETLFYTRLRAAYLLSRLISNRISTRTVLFCDIPSQQLSDAALRQLFHGVRHVWIASDVSELESCVNDRDQIALRLEQEEVRLIRATGDHRRRYKLRHGAWKGSIPADVYRWANEKRPLRRQKVFGSKIDVIASDTKTLPKLNAKTRNLQEVHLNGKGEPLPAAFVEFETVAAAESAFQHITSHMPKAIQASAIGLRPRDVIWANIGRPWWWRELLHGFAKAVVCATILLWAPITGFVGVLSNIDYAGELFSVKWIRESAPVVLGVLKGIVPTALLSIILALVPIFLSRLARFGVLSAGEAELRLQNWYFSFQVIQVFLLVTVGASATAVAAQIQAHPASFAAILSANLPKASNFYINMFVLQGLSISSATILNYSGLLVFAVLAPFLDNTPRKRYERAVTAYGVNWGQEYPKFTMLAVIFITYAVIAPLMLGFATFALVLVYAAFRYNFFFTLDTDTGSPSTQGRSYARALQHLTVGVYLGETCLLGLFAVGAATDLVSLGPAILMLGLCFATYRFHAKIRSDLARHVLCLPRDLLADPHGSEAQRKLPERQRWRCWSYFTSPAIPELPRELSMSPPDYSGEQRKVAYLHPAITSKEPLVWMVHDNSAGLSELEKSELEKASIQVSDKGVRIDSKTGALWTVAGDAFGGQDRIEKAPIYRREVVY